MIKYSSTLSAQVGVLVAAILLVIGQYLSGSIIMGVLGISIVAYVFTKRTLGWGWLSDDLIYRFVFGWLLILSSATAILLLIYFLVGLPAIVPLFVLCIVSAFVIYLPSVSIDINVPKIKCDYKCAPLALFIIADLMIVLFLLFARTDGALISPWNVIPGEVFVIYFISTLLLFWLSENYSFKISLLLGVLHTAVSVMVSAVVYGIGFGFDPFIHRATESALAELGRISPVQILYSGQYVVVAALHHLTSVPVKVVDIWITPALTSIMLPFIAFIGLRDGFGLSEQKAASLWFLILVVPYMLLTFTVPFSVTYILFIAILFLLPVFGRSIWTETISLFVSIVSIFFHPLLAVPYTIWLLGAAVMKRVVVKWKTLILLLLSLSVAVSIPALMTIYQYSKGQEVIWGGVLVRLSNFISLFFSPYVDRFPYISMYLNLIYGIRYWLPVVIVFIGIYGMIISWRHNRRAVALFMSFAVGLMTSILLLSTMFVFKDIISHEQQEFALRLLQSWYMIFVPFFIVVVARLWNVRMLGMVVKMLLAFLLALSWYFSYPQFNLKYPFFAPSVSFADLEAVRLIDSDATGKYIVLSNQMMSAAALQEFGFRDYVSVAGEDALWYAIPTGGKLYSYYSKIIFEDGSIEAIDELHRVSDVNEIYFVMHSYWPWREEFVEALKVGADKVLHINNNEVVIFKYRY